MHAVLKDPLHHGLQSKVLVLRQSKINPHLSSIFFPGRTLSESVIHRVHIRVTVKTRWSLPFLYLMEEVPEATVCREKLGQVVVQPSVLSRYPLGQIGNNNTHSVSRTTMGY